jgi:hypothetical protein
MDDASSFHVTYAPLASEYSRQAEIVYRLAIRRGQRERDEERERGFPNTERYSYSRTEAFVRQQHPSIHSPCLLCGRYRFQLSIVRSPVTPPSRPLQYGP